MLRLRGLYELELGCWGITLKKSECTILYAREFAARALGAVQWPSLRGGWIWRENVANL